VFDKQLGECATAAANVDPSQGDEQMACSVKHQAALLLGRLGWHKPHIRPADRLADRFRIGRIDSLRGV
jgi:hypothetical protein